jgi:hypothetical protein
MATACQVSMPSLHIMEQGSTLINTTVLHESSQQAMFGRFWQVPM